MGRFLAREFIPFTLYLVQDSPSLNMKTKSEASASLLWGFEG
ncbi:hypothetical protein FHR87_001450 [Azomonas macrocytogenes]|uniref:Uncharacterized protein n=1 Tax=Azomonas macrocytogenes TaxID=69962 RepID=A0A839T562_AZOMA|nr:hypothetical protein [Azomonas macrocytogenes]